MTEASPFANKSGRTVTFDEESLKNKGGSRAPLPEGDYYLRVLAHDPSAARDDMDALKFAEVESDQWVFDNLVYTDKGKWKVAQILISAEVIAEITPGMTVTVPDLTGKTVRARVFIDQKQNPPRNKIGEYLPPIK